MIYFHSTKFLGNKCLWNKEFLVSLQHEKIASNKYAASACCRFCLQIEPGRA